MNPTQHPSNTRVFGAPAGWDQADLHCNPLAVTDVEIDGRHAIISFWRPTVEELEQLAAGALVALWVYGSGHPVVSLAVEP